MGADEVPEAIEMAPSPSCCLPVMGTTMRLWISGELNTPDPSRFSMRLAANAVTCSKKVRSTPGVLFACVGRDEDTSALVRESRRVALLVYNLR